MATQGHVAGDAPYKRWVEDAEQGADERQRRGQIEGAAKAISEPALQ